MAEEQLLVQTPGKYRGTGHRKNLSAKEVGRFNDLNPEEPMTVWSVHSGDDIPELCRIPQLEVPTQLPLSLRTEAPSQPSLGSSSVDKILQWAEAVNYSMSEVDIVVGRRLITTLCQTPYNRKQGWKVNLYRCNNTLFLDSADEPYVFGPDLDCERYGKWSKVFEDVMRTGGRRTPGYAGQDVDIRMTRLVQLGPLKLLTNSSIGSQLPGDHQDVLENYVEIKTAPVSETEYDQRVKFEKYKTRYIWAHCAPLGIDTVYIGRRTEEGDLKEIQKFTMKDLVGVVSNCWTPECMLSFLMELLCWVEDKTSNGMTYSLTYDGRGINDPVRLVPGEQDDLVRIVKASFPEIDMVEEHLLVQKPANYRGTGHRKHLGAKEVGRFNDLNPEEPMTVWSVHSGDDIPELCRIPQLEVPTQLPLSLRIEAPLQPSLGYSSVDKILQWAEAVNYSMSEVDIVVGRRLITTLCQTPYNRTYGWKVNLYRCNNTLFLESADEPYDDDQYGKWSKVFEDVMRTGGRRTPGYAGQDVDIRMTRLVQLGPLKLLTNSSIGSQLPGDHQDVLENYVEIKTAAVSETGWERVKFEKYKTRSIWAHCAPLGIDSIYIGCSTEEGDLKEIQKFTMKDLARVASNYWTPLCMLSFLKELLSWVQNKTSNGMTYSLTYDGRGINDPVRLVPGEQDDLVRIVKASFPEIDMVEEHLLVQKPANYRGTGHRKHLGAKEVGRFNDLNPEEPMTVWSVHSGDDIPELCRIPQLEVPTQLPLSLRIEAPLQPSLGYSSVDKILQWAEAVNYSMSEVDIVVGRRLITTLCQTPYNRTYEWKVNLYRCNNTLFLESADEPYDDDQYGKWSKVFEDVMRTGGRRTPGYAGQDVDIRMTRLVQLGPLKLLTNSSIGSQLPGDHQDVLENYVEIKTAAVSETGWERVKFEKYKTRSIWAHCAPLGIDSIYIGCSTEEGDLKEIQKFTMKDLARVASNYWTPECMLSFLKELLSWVQNKTSNGMTYSLTYDGRGINDPVRLVPGEQDDLVRIVKASFPEE